MLPGYVRVANVSDVLERRGSRVRVGDEEIALWRIDARLSAISNVCAHQQVSALHQGTMHGLTVTCPILGWAYSLEDGASVSGSGRVRSLRTVIEGDGVYVEASGE